MNKRILLVLVAVAAMILLVSPVYAANVASKPNADAKPKGAGFNTPGNVLITDQFNNRVIEVNKKGEIVWSFGSGDPGSCPASSFPSNTIIAPNWAERLAGGLTLIAGTGTSSCSDNRVIVVNQGGDIVWQYGQYGITGNGDNQLSVPVSAIQLPSGNILITDQGNNRIIEVTLNKQVVLTIGPTLPDGSSLLSPNSAELLSNGHILIADEGNNRAIEVDTAGNIVWSYQANGAVAFASRLPNGNTLVTDAGDALILEVTTTDNPQVVFQYYTVVPNGVAAPSPSNAVKLKNGDISIADQFNNRVFIIKPDKKDNRDSRIVFQYGQLNVVGNTAGLLYAPYTAFVIGDYTGQTPPPSSFVAK